MWVFIVTHAPCQRKTLTTCGLRAQLWELSVLSWQLLCKSKTTLKIIFRFILLKLGQVPLSRNDSGIQTKGRNNNGLYNNLEVNYSGFNASQHIPAKWFIKSIGTLRASPFHSVSL